jgi:hypothetical protein
MHKHTGEKKTHTTLKEATMASICRHSSVHHLDHLMHDEWSEDEVFDPLAVVSRALTKRMVLFTILRVPSIELLLPFETSLSTYMLPRTRCFGVDSLRTLPPNSC